ncbi:MAG: hypothetical protein TRG1_2075 [Flavobacteriaceae bacterium FS1-H7996/R]|nr:MAG: hypothetical protein TRG1_2075 [Flavobacteriaceae bacterium FS1-H7996/R]
MEFLAKIKKHLVMVTYHIFASSNKHHNNTKKQRTSIQ